MNATSKIEPPRNVYQRLNEARLRFHATELRKSGKNTFAGYSYFELGDFLVPALKIFNEVGLSAYISFSDTLATMTIVNTDEIGDRLHIESPMGSAALKGCHEVQNIGAVETYQRRYLWVTALEIVEHDALDASEPAGERSQRGKVSPRQDTPSNDPITDEQLVKLQSLVQVSGTNPGALLLALKAPKGATLEQMPQRLFDAAVDLLTDQLAERARNETNTKAKETA